MSSDDIFGGAFVQGASREREPDAQEIEAARKRFKSILGEVIRPVFLEMGGEIAAQGNSFEVVDSKDAQKPSISLVVRVKGENYQGKVEPPCLTYEFDPQTLKVRMGGWITIPSKRNYAKVLAVALLDCDSVSRESVRKRLSSFLREIHELTVAEDSFLHIPVEKKV